MKKSFAISAIIFDRKKINEILLTLYMLSAAYTPSDTFYVKKISLLLLLVLNFDCFLRIKGKDEKIVFFFGFALTSFNILWSIIVSGAVYQNISVGYPGYILLLYFVIKDYRIDFKRIFLTVVFCMAVFTVIVGLLSVTGIRSVYDSDFVMWFHRSSNAMIGEGGHLVLGFMVFMKTSPMFLLASAYSFKEGKFFEAFIFQVALIFSGTRANIFVSLIFLWLTIIFCTKNMRTKYCVFLLTAAAVVLIWIKLDITSTIQNMFELKAASDSVRSDTLGSIISAWKDDFLAFFIGQGFAGTFYDFGRRVWTFETELSYWNLLRQLGIFLFVPTIGMYLYPIYKLFKEKEWFYIFAYVGFLVISYTNPFLYSSTGITILLYVYLVVYESECGVLWRASGVKCSGV